MQIEKESAVRPLPDEVWERLLRLKLGQLVDELVRLSAQE
jgi:hypothetical protein